MNQNPLASSRGAREFAERQARLGSCVSVRIDGKEAAVSAQSLMSHVRRAGGEKMFLYPI
jgi:hypothetical protein